MGGSLDPGSFRDPSGFVFRRHETIYRQVNASYAEEYEHLVSSGLYEELAQAGLLIPHEEVDTPPPRFDSAYRVIRPEMIPFVSYPYEWCFGQLRDAALAHLEVQRRALAHGMTLKDCSAYNIQFRDGKPVLIDTLSFERYREGEPWVAYRQFCQHFLAPLALMSHTDVRLGRLLRVHVDGIPLDLASRLLPLRTRCSIPLLLHIHLHASYAKRASRSHRGGKRAARLSRRSLENLVRSLRTGIGRLRWRPRDSYWAGYYSELHDYRTETAEHKAGLVAEFLDHVRPSRVWDFGANTGRYGRIAADRGIPTVSFDFDPACVETIYEAVRNEGATNVLPLVMDLANPSPGIGWAGAERSSLRDRGPTDMLLALALLHHLAISNNVPIPAIIDFFSELCRFLVVEFVPKNDAQVRELLAGRRDVFADYTQAAFESSLGRTFRIERVERLRGSDRILYLAEKR